MNIEVQIWKKYGSYLIGVTGISAKYKQATFEQFLYACDGQFGGWSKEALAKAWNNGR